MGDVLDLYNLYMKMPEIIILDIDETLVHATPILNGDVESYVNQDGFVIANTDVISLSFIRKRKHLDYFISELKRRNKIVIVWSAGSPRYVKMICDILFGRDMLRYILTRKHHLECGKKKDISHIGRSKLIPNFNLANAVLIDDRPENAIDNPKHIIVVKPFEGKDDDELLRVLDLIG